MKANPDNLRVLRVEMPARRRYQKGIQDSRRQQGSAREEQVEQHYQDARRKARGRGLPEASEDVKLVIFESSDLFRSKVARGKMSEQKPQVVSFPAYIKYEIQ